MVKYKCFACKKKFPVKRWFNYIVWNIVYFGAAHFYCDKCYELKGGD